MKFTTALLSASILLFTASGLLNADVVSFSSTSATAGNLAGANGVFTSFSITNNSGTIMNGIDRSLDLTATPFTTPATATPASNLTAVEAINFREVQGSDFTISFGQAVPSPTFSIDDLFSSPIAFFVNGATTPSAFTILSSNGSLSTGSSGVTGTTVPGLTTNTGPTLIGNSGPQGEGTISFAGSVTSLRVVTSSGGNPASASIALLAHIPEEEAVPEPSSFAMLMIFGASICARRRRI